MDKPVAHVSCATGKVPVSDPRVTQKARPSCADRAERFRPGHSRVDQDNLQHQGVLPQGG